MLAPPRSTATGLCAGRHGRATVERRRSRRTPMRAALRAARAPRGRPARDSAPLPRASGRLLALGVGRRGRRRALPWPPRLPRPWRAGADEAGEGGDWSWAWAPLQVGPGCQPPLPFYLLGVYLFNFG